MQQAPYEVAAEGTIEYQYFVVDPQFKEDRWVRHAQLMPSNRSVVHHGIVFIRPPDGITIQGIGWLTAYVPGQVFQRATGSSSATYSCGFETCFSNALYSQRTPRKGSAAFYD